jgi:hypothetical protein
MKTRRRWLIPLVTVAIGALLMLVGSLVRGEYARGVWSDLGTAVVLFGPLYGLQWMLEKGMSEVRRQAHETRSSLQQLTHEIEAIRQQTAASLDDLRNVALQSVQRLRASDEEAFRRFREAPTFESIVGLIRRARELGAISGRGVRVRLPDTTFRLRFPLPGRPDNGDTPVLDVGLEEEDGTLPHDATAPKLAIRGQRPVPWSAAQSAGEWAASVAPELQRLNRYPGDERFDPAGALGQLMSVLRLAIEARTRPPSAAAPMPRLRPLIEVPNDEWGITEDGLQSLTSEAAFTVRELFDISGQEAAVAALEDEHAEKLREAWRLAQCLFLSP